MLEKFSNPKVTAKGEARACVELRELKTIWFNTGTQCNLSCENCYIESNPTNDRLSFLTSQDIQPYLEEIKKHAWPTQEIGFTGGEPFLNPHIIELIETSLENGFKTIILTNAYRIIQRYKETLVDLKDRFGDQLLLRVSLDHHSKEVHEEGRGKKTFEPTLNMIRWLSQNQFNIGIAGRHLCDEDFHYSQDQYKKLLNNYSVDIDFSDSQKFVIFPEMDPNKDVPEITTACWSILNKSPDKMMCASSRMIVKRKGEDCCKVLACTLLAYDKQFELGETLALSCKNVPLNHKFCAQFCVLGGASCS